MSAPSRPDADLQYRIAQQRRAAEMAALDAQLAQLKLEELEAEAAYNLSRS